MAGCTGKLHCALRVLKYKPPAPPKPAPSATPGKAGHKVRLDGHHQHGMIRRPASGQTCRPYCCDTAAKQAGSVGRPAGDDDKY